jgi:hypothetical protein
MSQIINFVNRSNIATTNNKSQQVDAIKIIEYFSSLHPLNRVKPNSLLYETAVNQYNQNIKNTLIRPTVPSWFCGKINPETGDLINNPSDESLRATAGVVLDPLTLQPTISGDTLSGYVVDTCLILGTPGSYDYTKCAEGRDAAEVAELVSDWLTGMESVGGLEEFAAEGEGEESSSSTSTSKKKKKNKFQTLAEIALLILPPQPINTIASVLTNPVTKIFNSITKYF